MQRTVERRGCVFSGLVMLGVLCASGITTLLVGGLGLRGIEGAGAACLSGGCPGAMLTAAAAIPLGLLTSFVFFGFYSLQPNHSAVLTLFGAYRCTDRRSGLRWANPIYGKRKISLRIRNLETSVSKVNDADGNPILIGAVIVWQVTDPARATFDVDHLDNYIQSQSEAAVRHLARSFPYDALEEPAEGEPEIASLVGSADEVNDRLSEILQERLGSAGVSVIEARLTELSYAPEVAEAMLKRQQASAIIAARRKIVDGAVSMVRDVIAQLEEGAPETAISLSPASRATFAANLMTVMVSDSPTNPVVSVGGR